MDLIVKGIIVLGLILFLIDLKPTVDKLKENFN
jgi:hypothetical protein